MPEQLELDFLANVPDVNEDDDGSTVTLDSTASESNATPESTATPESATSTGDQQASGTDAPSNADSQSGLRTDEKGNLVDAKGSVVIAAGHTGRVFEQLHGDLSRREAEAIELNKRIQELERTSQQAPSISDEVLNGLPAKFNMSREDVNRGLIYWNKLRADPENAVKELVGLAREAGHSIDGIGQATDINAIKATLQEVLAPVLKQQEQIDAASRRRAEAEKQIKDFFGKRPDAMIQRGALQALLRQQPQMSLDEAYYELKLAALDNGLDWRIPLENQMDKKQEDPRPSTPPLGPGQSRPSSAMTRTEDAIAIADPSESFEDIVRAAFAQVNQR